MRQNRRRFLQFLAFSAATPALVGPVVAKETGRYRAAIIGRTGGGDYGHGYDQIFNDLEPVSVEAVADHDPQGLRRAAERSKAKRQYLDYREMLDREKPDLVCIASRQPDCHRPMALAAIDCGAHLFLEKPFTETVADADAILAAAEAKGVKIAVAHTRRYHPDFRRVKYLLEEGRAGQIREVRIQGKQDHRAGGEDLIVLGTHDFDLMRFYFGDPLWCFAHVATDQQDTRPADAHSGREPVRVAGDTIHALFAFPRNLMIHWTSVSTTDHWNTNFSPRGKWGFEIFGTKGIIAHQSGLDFAWLDSPFLAQPDGSINWRKLPEPKPDSAQGPALHPILDLIRAIETDREALCSGTDGRWAIEMVTAIYQSHFQQARIALPLKNRTHPL